VGDEAWQARLAELAITNERHVLIATEGALLGGLVARGVSPELVVLSDGAPQFVIFVHAGCWIHAERPLAKLVPYHDEHRAAIEKIRTPIWEFYKDLKAYRLQPDEAQRPVFETRFDALVEQRTGYPSINGVLKEMRDHKADLLRVLERPEVPLHNNAMESDIREFVKRRKISGGTRNDAGPSLPRHFCQLEEDLSKAGHTLLGLSARPGSRPEPNSSPGRSDPQESAADYGPQRPSRARLTENGRHVAIREQLPNAQIAGG